MDAIAPDRGEVEPLIPDRSDITVIDAHHVRGEFGRPVPRRSGSILEGKGQIQLVAERSAASTANT